MQRDGKLDWVAVGFGSARGRVRMETKLAGEGAEGKVTGAYAPHGRQHVDFDTTQEHAAPNTFSDLAFRGILAGRSTAVWRGVIKVDPGAQQTDAFQECRNLLLSKRAHVDAIPGLEILANDVRCTHAAAIAQIDKDQLFYLRSRGLPEPQAQRLVIEGFMAELVERFEEGHDPRGPRGRARAPARHRPRLELARVSVEVDGPAAGAADPDPHPVVALAQPRGAQARAVRAAGREALRLHERLDDLLPRSTWIRTFAARVRRKATRSGRFVRAAERRRARACRSAAARTCRGGRSPAAP